MRYCFIACLGVLNNIRDRANLLCRWNPTAWQFTLKTMVSIHVYWSVACGTIYYAAGNVRDDGSVFSSGMMVLSFELLKLCVNDILVWLLQWKIISSSFFAVRFNMPCKLSTSIWVVNLKKILGLAILMQATYNLIAECFALQNSSNCSVFEGI